MCVKQLVLLFCVSLLAICVKGQSVHKYQASNTGDDGFSQSGIPFALSASGTLEACVGGSAEFNVLVRGTEVYNYTWRKIEDAAFRMEGKPVLKLSSLKLANSGHYYCIVEDLNGKQTACSDTLELKVFNLPSVSLRIDGGKNRIARGDSICLIKEVNAEDYHWNVEMPASGWVKPAQSTCYVLTGTNGNQCTAVASVEVEVVDLYLQPGPSLQISLGQDRILSVNTNADTVLWYAKSPVRSAKSRMSIMSYVTTHPEWGNYVGSGPSIKVEPATSMVYTAVGYVGAYAAVTTLSVGVKNTYKGGTEDGFTQSDIPFGVLSLPDTLRVCQNDSITFAAVAQGVSAYDYTWYRINGSGNQQLVEKNICKLSNCTFAHEGRYFCKVTDRLSGYALNSDTIYLKVDERPFVKIISPLTDTVICYGDSLSLAAGLQPALTHISISDVCFQWSGFGLVSGENTRNARVAPTVRTTYI
nr:hypothetical protein [Odoribacter sp.]